MDRIDRISNFKFQICNSYFPILSILSIHVNSISP